MEQNNTKNIFGVLRFVMGFIFLWAFLDKLFGFGFATTTEKAWLLGGSPTAGFLQFGVHGPFTDFYNSLAGSALIDWLFMLGLLFVGISLVFGIFMKLGGWTGIFMLFLMYTAVGISPANNPIIDDHIVYILIILVLISVNAGRNLGLGSWWENTLFVQRHKLFK